MSKHETAIYTFEGNDYEYDVVAAKSIALARCLYGVEKNHERILDAFEALFGAYADVYWAELSNDEKAVQLVIEIYNGRSKN